VHAWSWVSRTGVGAVLAQRAGVFIVRLFVSSTLLVAACADAPPPAPAGDDLPLGDVDGDVKADGEDWGAALDCKAIPDVRPCSSRRSRCRSTA